MSSYVVSTPYWRRRELDVKYGRLDSIRNQIAMAKKPPAPSDLADKFMLRLPSGMRDRLAAAAKETGRSMNSEIVSRLEKSLDQFKTLSQLVEEVEQTHELWSRIEDLEAAVADLREQLKRRR